MNLINGLFTSNKSFRSWNNSSILKMINRIILIPSHFIIIKLLLNKLLSMWYWLISLPMAFDRLFIELIVLEEWKRRLTAFDYFNPRSNTWVFILSNDSRRNSIIDQYWVSTRFHRITNHNKVIKLWKWLMFCIIPILNLISQKSISSNPLENSKEKASFTTFVQISSVWEYVPQIWIIED